MFWGIRLEEWLTIAAIVLGPLLAFAIQRWRDSLREKQNRQRLIFQQLLLTLKAPMARRHVDALNSIPLEFHSDTKIMEAWRLYTSHLNDKAMLQNNNRGWGEKKFGLLIDLIYTIGKSLGYGHLDKATIKDHIYTPQGYDDIEEQFRQIRESLLQVLRGQHPIPVTTVGPVEVETPLKPLAEIPTPQRPALPAAARADEDQLHE